MVEQGMCSDISKVQTFVLVVLETVFWYYEETSTGELGFDRQSTFDVYSSPVGELGPSYTPPLILITYAQQCRFVGLYPI